jgi:hypothetical protein
MRAWSSAVVGAAAAMVVCLQVETTIFQHLGSYGNLVQQRLSGERWLGFAGIRQRQRIVTVLDQQEFDRGGELAMQRAGI